MATVRASRTARKVLEGIVVTAATPTTAHLVSPQRREDAERLLAAIAGEAAARRLRRPWGRVGYRLLERAVMPHVGAHHSVRKAWIADAIDAAIGRGATRVVVLGAGLDPLPLRVAAAHPDLEVIEIDHPATQVDKRRAYARLGDPPANLTLAPADLATTRLADAGVSPGPRSVVVAEGLLVYLAPHEAASLLLQARDVAGEDGDVLVTMVRETVPPGSEGLLLKVLLRVYGERAAFRADVDAFCAQAATLGLDVAEVVTGPELVRAALGASAPRRPQDSEYLVRLTPR